MTPFLWRCKNWRALVDEVGTAIRSHNGYIYIPDLSENIQKTD